MNERNEIPGEDRFWSFRWFALGLGALLALRFNGVLTGLESFTLRDFCMFGYPLAAQLQRSLFAGELPLWDTLTQCGTPFFAQWNTMALYPPMWLATLLPLSWSLSVFCVAHQFLGGLGAWQLARRFTGDDAAAALAGIAYTGHGLTQGSLMWPNNSAALGLLPWVLLLVERACRERERVWFAAALTGALQMLTGGPEVILLTWITAAGLVAAQAWRQTDDMRERARRLVALAALVLAVTLLSAVQLLPFAELLENSHREAGFGGDQWSASALAWANLLLPLFATIEHPGPIFYHQSQGWTHSYYPGMTVLALAAIAPFLARDRRVWIASAAALLLLVISMGDAGGVYPWIGRIPPFNLLRFPVKFLIPLTILLPLLGAIGFARLRQTPAEKAPSCDFRRCAWLFALLGLAWITAFLLGLNNDRIARNDFVANSITRLLLFGLASVPLLVRARGRAWRPLAPVVIAVVALDLQFHQPNLAPTIPARNYHAPIPAVEELREALSARGGRAALTSLAVQKLNSQSLANKGDTLLLDRLALFGDCNLIDRVPKVNGFYSLYLRDYRQVQVAFHAREDEPSKPIADFLGVSRVMRLAHMFRWEKRDGAMPLVTGGQRPVFADGRAGLARFADAGFNPRAEVILGEPARGHVPTLATKVVISEIEQRPHRLRFIAEADTNSLSVIAQAGYPAWTARVNGAPSPILRANHAFQAVAIPPGRSEVILEYRDRRFQIGLLISALSFCFFGGGLLWRRTKGDPTAAGSQ